jgi:hypothetical protein
VAPIAGRPTMLRTERHGSAMVRNMDEAFCSRPGTAIRYIREKNHMVDECTIKHHKQDSISNTTTISSHPNPLPRPQHAEPNEQPRLSGLDCQHHHLSIPQREAIPLALSALGPANVHPPSRSPDRPYPRFLVRSLHLQVWSLESTHPNKQRM